MQKPHGNTNKKNAMRGTVPADAFLHIRITPDLKSSAQQFANDRGMSLSQLVCEALESAVRV